MPVYKNKQLRAKHEGKMMHNSSVNVSNLTTKQLASKLGIEYVVASNMVKFLSGRGIITQVDKVKPPSGKGKPSIVWAVPETFEVNLDLNKVFSEAETP